MLPYLAAEFEPVSIKMAKTQGLSLNPAKISGICGRLMCCLKYENEAYCALKAGLPDQGERVRTPDGVGVVVETNILREKVKVRLVQDSGRKEQSSDEEKLSADVSVYNKSEIRRLGKKRNVRRQEEEDLNALPEEVKSLLGD